MQNGPYIVDRWMVGMLRDICQTRGISFRSFSNDWVLEFEKDSRRRRVIGYQFDLNSAAASQIAQDKVAAYQVLTSQLVPAVPHFLLRTKAGDAQWQAISWKDGAVIKPLMGTGGQGVALLFDEIMARRMIRQSDIEAWAASPLQDAAREVRVILLDGECLFSYQKQPVVHKDGLKLFNLGQGATPIRYEPEDAVIELARRAQRAIDLRVCAVDIFQLVSGEWRVLEVNSGFMMEYYARFSEENKRRAIMIYEKIVDAMFHPPK